MKVVALFRPLPHLLANRRLLSPPRRRSITSKRCFCSSRTMPEEIPFVPASETELRSWLVREELGHWRFERGLHRSISLSLFFLSFLLAQTSFLLSLPPSTTPTPQVLQRRRPGQVRPFARIEDDRRPPPRGRARGERALPGPASLSFFFLVSAFLVFLVSPPSSSSHHLHGPPSGQSRPRARHPLLR